MKNTSKCSFSAAEIFERLKSFLKIDKDNELANVLGEAPNKLATWKTRNTIPFELLIQKSHEGLFDLDFIFGIKTTKRSDEKLEDIPMMAWCAAGYGGQEMPVDWQDTLKIPGVPTKGVYALRVAGDSMINVIFPGDILICREIPVKTVRHGLTYAFVTEDGTSVKQFFYEQGKVRLHSYNRNIADYYPDQIYRSYEILRVIHEYREVETFEFSDSLDAINEKLDSITNLLKEKK